MNQDRISDPSGYAVVYAADWETFNLIRLVDERKVGNYPTRRAAVEAAGVDAAEVAAAPFGQVQ